MWKRHCSAGEIAAAHSNAGLPGRPSGRLKRRRGGSGSDKGVDKWDVRRGKLKVLGIFKKKGQTQTAGYRPRKQQEVLRRRDLLSEVCRAPQRARRDETTS